MKYFVEQAISPYFFESDSKTKEGKQALQEALKQNVEAALAEDIGTGDLTSALLPSTQISHAYILVRESAVLCGVAWFMRCLIQVDASIQVQWHYAEGELMTADTPVCEITGPVRALLTAERCALNFLQLLSGVATLTHHYVEAIAGTSAKIYDTRKTLPGMRLAQKYAVRVGGGQNQRLGLYDAILIKENHIAAAGSITAAYQAALSLTQSLDHAVSIQIEVETLEQLTEALHAQASSILLDNFCIQNIYEAVQITQRLHASTQLEVSGGVDLTTVRAIAETGVQRISIGVLTKNVQATDYSMRLEKLS